MHHRNLDFEIPLTREQWEQLGRSANFRPDYGVLRWTPSEFEVISLSIRDTDAPEGWEGVVPRDDGVPPGDREVARFVYNDGRPFAQLEPPDQPEPPAVSADESRSLEEHLERWVRGKWHELLADSGIHFDRGALPPDEPRAPHR
jgi:hypothetical protein